MCLLPRKYFDATPCKCCIVYTPRWRTYQTQMNRASSYNINVCIIICMSGSDICKLNTCYKRKGVHPVMVECNVFCGVTCYSINTTNIPWGSTCCRNDVYPHVLAQHSYSTSVFCSLYTQYVTSYRKGVLYSVCTAVCYTCKLRTGLNGNYHCTWIVLTGRHSTHSIRV